MDTMNSKGWCEGPVYEKHKDHGFEDCTTDADLAEFYGCGRAWEKGVIAPCISRDVAELYDFRAKLLPNLPNVATKEEADHVIENGRIVGAEDA